MAAFKRKMSPEPAIIGRSSTAHMKAKYLVLDFEEGPQIVSRNWLNDNCTQCAWPPWACSADQIEYDRNVKDMVSPEATWEKVVVQRIRYSGDDFQTVRSKLTEAAHYSDTDLNSATDTGAYKKKRRRAAKNAQRAWNSESESEKNLVEASGIKMPVAPLPTKNLNAPIKSSSNRKCNNLLKPVKIIQSKINKYGHQTVSKANNLKRSKDQPNSKSKVNNSRERSSHHSSHQLDVKKHSPEGVTKSLIVGNKNTSADTISPKHQQVAMNLGAQAKDTEATAPLISQASHQLDVEKDSQEGVRNTLIVGNTNTSADTMSATQRVAMDLATKMNDTEFKAFVIANFSTLRTAITQLRHSQRTSLFEGKVTHQIDLKDSPELEDPLLGLPAQNMRDWLEFDKRLSDKQYSKPVTEALAMMGGPDLGYTIRAIMKRVMCNEVAQQFSWQGGQGKKKFMELNMKLVLFGAVRLDKRWKTCQDRQIQDIAQKWLSLAKQRLLSKRKPGDLPSADEKTNKKHRLQNKKKSKSGRHASGSSQHLQESDESNDVDVPSDDMMHDSSGSNLPESDGDSDVLEVGSLSGCDYSKDEATGSENELDSE